ncbi:MAG: hypothetical protein PHQ74_00790 [Crocinitomicaceae bacterium]|nr:hypothetical protein [Crocinitomicaceae bacterium]
MRKLNLLLLLLISLFSFAFSASRPQKYDWSEIKEFKFYGNNDPINQQDVCYVLADVSEITEMFKNLKKSEGYLPKGAQNYATILFSDSSEITIQILPGLPSPIRVIEGKIFEDDWFEFDNNTAMKWIRCMEELKEELKIHQKNRK